MLKHPHGLAYDDSLNIQYMVDRGNHRVLMLPTFQFVALGCWRDSPQPQTEIMSSVEPTTRSDLAMSFLQGDYLNRPNAAQLCAMECLRLGYSKL